MDVGGYNRFKYLYFRSEYKASVSEPVSDTEAELTWC